MAVRRAAVLAICLAFGLGLAGAAPGSGSGPDQGKLPPSPHLVRYVMKAAKYGCCDRYDRVGLRQVGFDKVAIAQVQRDTRDGGRMTLAEARAIVSALQRRKARAPKPRCDPHTTCRG
jgi:hypothetical protein